ncbi:Hypothetical predicted protein, partial [Marmota monax]
SRSLCQLLQPPPKWPSTVVNTALPPLPGIAPSPTPRFGATHGPPNETTCSFHEGSRTNPLSFSGPSEDGSTCWKIQQSLAHCHHSGLQGRKGALKSQ